MHTKDKRLNILVLGDDTRSFLSVVRSFGHREWRVDVCPFDFSSPALRSVYIRSVFHLPIYHLDPDRWVSTLRKILSDGAYDFIVPCDDRSILPIHRHLDSFSGAPFALPNEDSMRIFYDKYETRQLARASGVPIAAGRRLTKDNSADGLAVEFGLPLVIKPRSSYVIDNVSMRNKVQLVHNINDLRKKLAVQGDRSRFLVESVVPGHGVGISVLAEHGRLVQAFEYHRVREPLSGGGSSYRVSKPLNPILVGYVEKLIAGSQLDGVAMFEFRYDPDSGEINLLEVNARFWGGFPLAIGAGIDFPWLLYRQSVLKEAVAATGYRTGYYARNAAADFYTVVETAQDLAQGSRFKAVLFLFDTVIAGLLRLALLKETNDTFSWADMPPFWAECGAILGSLSAKVSRMSGLTSHRKIEKSRNAVRSLMERVGGRRLRILFVCYGNICRSPFAEYYLRAKTGEKIDVSSSGVHPLIERSSPADAVDCARMWGVDDLDFHRSTHISLHADEPVDLVILFDDRNQANMDAGDFFQETVLTVKLGIFLDNADTGADIEDPYGRGSDIYRAIYGQIATAVDNLVSMTGKIPRDKTD